MSLLGCIVLKRLVLQPTLDLGSIHDHNRGVAATAGRLTDERAEITHIGSALGAKTRRIQCTARVPLRSSLGHIGGLHLKHDCGQHILCLPEGCC